MSNSATATWLVSEAVTRALSRARSSRSPSGSPVRASKRSPHPVLPRRRERLAKRSDLLPRRAQRGFGLGQADEAVGADGRDVPIEGALQQVGGSRLDRRLGPPLARAQGEHGDARDPPRELADRLVQVAAVARPSAARSVTTIDGRRSRASASNASPTLFAGAHLEPGRGQPPRRVLVGGPVRARHQGDARAPGRAPTDRPPSVSNIGIAGSATVEPQLARWSLPKEWLSGHGQGSRNPLESASVMTGPVSSGSVSAGVQGRAVRPHLGLRPQLGLRPELGLSVVHPVGPHLAVRAQQRLDVSRRDPTRRPSPPRARAARRLHRPT